MAGLMLPLCPHVGPQDGKCSVATSDLVSALGIRTPRDGTNPVATLPTYGPPSIGVKEPLLS